MADAPDAQPPASNDNDIPDVSLINPTVDAPTPDAPASDPAEQGKDDAADTSGKPAADDAKPDAKGTEAKDPADKSADQKPDDKSAPEGQQPDKPAPTQTPEQQREAQQAKARQEFQNRQRTRDQVGSQLDQNFGPKTEEQLVEEGMSASDAKVEALRQEMAYNNERSRVTELNANMQADAVNVQSDFPVYREFNPDGTRNPDYDPEFTQKVDQLYQTSARINTVEVGKDPQGNPIKVITNAEVPLYDFYKSMADVYSRGKANGNQQGQEDALHNLSRTENPGGSSSTAKTPGAEESVEEMEERLGGVVIT